MLSINQLSALIAVTSFMSSAMAATGTSSVIQIATPTAEVAAKQMKYIGCFESSDPLEDHGPSDFQTDGLCQQICLGFQKDVLALSSGNHCLCGDKIPKKADKVPDTQCDIGCAGSPDAVKCGGKNRWSVWDTRRSLTEPDYYEGAPSSSASSSSAGPSTTAAPPTSSSSTAPASETPSASAPPKSKPNTAGIAAGVVVGVVALAAIIGGVIFWLRQKKRREVEDEYRNRASVNNFVSGGKMHTSNSSMTDSRLDPDFMARRQSNGSIADNEDYSRRILKVTNA